MRLRRALMNLLQPAKRNLAGASGSYIKSSTSKQLEFSVRLDPSQIYHYVEFIKLGAVRTTPQYLSGPSIQGGSAQKVMVSSISGV